MPSWEVRTGPCPRGQVPECWYLGSRGLCITEREAETMHSCGESGGQRIWSFDVQKTGKNIGWVSEAGDGGCSRWMEGSFLKTLSLNVILEMKRSLQAVLTTRTIAVKGWLRAWLTGHRWRSHNESCHQNKDKMRLCLISLQKWGLGTFFFK